MGNTSACCNYQPKDKEAMDVNTPQDVTSGKETPKKKLSSRGVKQQIRIQTGTDKKESKGVADGQVKSSVCPGGNADGVGMIAGLRRQESNLMSEGSHTVRVRALDKMPDYLTEITKKIEEEHGPFSYE